MCSSSPCDIAGLIHGPVGNLVGMGIRALVDRAAGSTPAGTRSAEALGRQRELAGIEAFYENVEAHLRGTLRVLQPALEIKNALLGECKSAGNERPAPNHGTPIAYYTPQNTKKISGTNCSPCSGSAKKIPRNSLLPAITPRSHCTGPSSTPRLTTRKSKRDSPSLEYDKCSNNKCRRKDTSKSLFSSPVKNNTDAKSGIASNGRIAKRGTSSRSVIVCHSCDVSSKDNSMLAVLPCKHVFCYPCLARGKYPKCQKCEKSFDMKNVTEIRTRL